MSNSSNPVFNPSCPSGGQYYACGIGAKFVGCCASDPCNDAGCSAGNLRTMSFDPAYYNTTQMPDQQCSATGQQWWSCKYTDPPFIGCCSINPCSSGCPQANLIQGTLSSVASIANAFDPQPPLDSTSTTAATSTPTETSNTSSSDTSSRLSTGALVGIAVGGSVLVLFIVALIWWWRRRAQHRRREKSALNPVLSPHSAYHNEKTSNYRDLPSESNYSAQATPLPIYGFQSPPPPQQYHHQTTPPQIIHEAYPANQIHQSPGLSSPTPTTTYSLSPGIGKGSSPSHYPQPLSELVGDHTTQSQQQLNGLGLQRLSEISQTPAELGDSERGTDDTKERNQRW